ncbi:putative MFS transporter [Xylaria venustula]|nr:putative MFS transporter [Xylaria venustula]
MTEEVGNVEANEATATNEYLRGWALTSLTLALMSGSFMLALDNTILATAIPQITSDFSSLNDMDWYGSSYLLAQMSLLPSCGRIYTFYNIKRAYIILLLIFELGSVICALAPNSTSLIIGKAVAGLGAAGLLSGATVILSYCVALKQRAFLLSLILGIYGVGSVTGPLIGGAIIDNKSLGLTQLQKLRQMDIPGAILLIGSVTSLLLALQWGGIDYPWSDSRVFGTLIGFTYYWPIYFQSVRGTNARNSGIFTLPLAISNTLATLWAGWLTSKLGYYVPFMWIDALILAAGGGLYQLISTHSPATEWIGYQIISGIGYGMSSQMAIIAVQVVLDKPDVPTGCVMVIFFQAQNLFTDKLVHQLNQIKGVNTAVIISTGGRDFRSLIPAALIEPVAEAFSSALANVFLATLAAPLVSLVISAGVEWRRLPKDHKTDEDMAETAAAPEVQSEE